MTTTTSLRIALLAAALAVALPSLAPAQGMMDPDADKENRAPARKPAADRVGPGEAPGFAPRGGEGRQPPEKILGGEELGIEDPRGVQPCKDGFVTIRDVQVLFRKRAEKPSIIFRLEHEATAWWALPDASGFLYTFEGKLRYRPADPSAAETVLGEAPAGAVAVTGKSAAWIASGTAFVSVGGETPRKVAAPDGRDFASLALSPDGSQLFAVLRPHGADRANEIAALPLAGETTWTTRVTSKDGALDCLSVCNDGQSLLFTEIVSTDAKARAAVKFLRSAELEAKTLVRADGVTEVLPSTDGRHAWLSSKAANGRRKIFRVELEMRPDAEEYFTDSVVGAEDADCSGLTRAGSNGVAYYVEKREGSVDKICRLLGF